jgi:hypothetical protein
MLAAAGELCNREASNQEARKEDSSSQFSFLLFAFFTAGLQNSGEFGKTADTIYETNDTSFVQ